MKSGKLLYLRAVEESDLSLFKEWRNNENLKKFFREYLELNEVSQQIWYENSVNKDNKTIMFSIVDIDSSELIGCCGLTYINWVNRNADFSFYIGRDIAYIDNDGYAIEAARILLDYGFNQINLHKIWTEIYEFDSVKEDFLSNLGFTKDAELRDNYFYDGKYWKSLIFSLLKSEYK
jgi:RimJ/RimL family protein N-acetyltransferase